MSTENTLDPGVIDATDGVDYAPDDDPAPQPPPNAQAAPAETDATAEGASADDPPDDAPVTREKVKEITGAALEAERARVEQEQLASQIAALKESAAKSENFLERIKSDPVAALAELRGISGAEVLSEINEAFIKGQKKPTTPQDVLRQEIEALKAQQKERDSAATTAKHEAQQAQILQYVEGLVTEEEFPLSHAYDAKATAALVTTEIWQHYEKNNSLDGVDVQGLLKQKEQLLLEELTKLTNIDSVRTKLGLTPAKQNADPSKLNSPLERPRADTGTLTPSETVDRPTFVDPTILSDQDDKLSDAALRRKAEAELAKLGIT
ncbi:MAG: hypothetical protein AAGE52_38665 [Myxococcota bacterium]